MSLNLLSLLGTGVGAFFGGPAGAAIGGALGGALSGKSGGLGQGAETGLAGGGILSLLGGFGKHGSTFNSAGEGVGLGGLAAGNSPTTNMSPDYGKIGSLLGSLGGQNQSQMKPYQQIHSQPVAQVQSNPLMSMPLGGQQSMDDFETWANQIYGQGWRDTHPEQVVRQLYARTHGQS